MTVAERILAHLGAVRHPEPGDELAPWPIEATQDGIARGVGISRSHVALEIRRLKGAQRVEENLRHVEGAKSRRLVYYPGAPLVIHNGTGKPLPLVRGEVRTITILVFRCPSCGVEAKVAMSGVAPRETEVKSG